MERVCDSRRRACLPQAVRTSAANQGHVCGVCRGEWEQIFPEGRKLLLRDIFKMDALMDGQAVILKAVYGWRLLYSVQLVLLRFTGLDKRFPKGATAIPAERGLPSSAKGAPHGGAQVPR